MYPDNKTCSKAQIWKKLQWKYNLYVISCDMNVNFLQLFKEGRITATKVALLKAKYTKMHDALKMLVIMFLRVNLTLL